MPTYLHVSVTCLWQITSSATRGATLSRQFGFHGVLPPSCRQSDVLQACGITQLLDAALAGFHVTIFAYGQTGSGKTFTMSGREDVLALENYAGGLLLTLHRPLQAMSIEHHAPLMQSVSLDNGAHDKMEASVMRLCAYLCSPSKMELAIRKGQINGSDLTSRRRRLGRWHCDTISDVLV